MNSKPLDAWPERYTKRLEKKVMNVAWRHKKMLAVNPKYIPKNRILQDAIENPQEHDFSMINELLKVALSPFDEYPDLEHLCKPAPMESQIAVHPYVARRI